MRRFLVFLRAAGVREAAGGSALTAAASTQGAAPASKGLGPSSPDAGASALLTSTRNKAGDISDADGVSETTAGADAGLFGVAACACRSLGFVTHRSSRPLNNPGQGIGPALAPDLGSPVDLSPLGSAWRATLGPSRGGVGRENALARNRGIGTI